MTAPSSAAYPQLNESSLKESLGGQDGEDPLDVLGRILYAAQDGSRTAPERIGRPWISSGYSEQLESIDLKGQSLRAFAEAIPDDGYGPKAVHVPRVDGVGECM